MNTIGKFAKSFMDWQNTDLKVLPTRLIGNGGNTIRLINNNFNNGRTSMA